MATQKELIDRGNYLAAKYGKDDLESALKNAIAMSDNEERLSLQWALKQKGKTTDGYSFTKEAQENMQKRLA